MSGADDLRTAIEDAIFDEIDGHSHGPHILSERSMTRVVEHVLADPALRLAILDAMGLEVTEGRGSQDEEKIWTIGPPDGLDLPGDLDVLVVRPRGDAS